MFFAFDRESLYSVVDSEEYRAWRATIDPIFRAKLMACCLALADTEVIAYALFEGAYISAFLLNRTQAEISMGADEFLRFD